MRQLARKLLLPVLAISAIATGHAAQDSATATAPKLMALPQGAVAWARELNEVREADPGLALTHLTVLLKRTPERQQAFEELLRQQQDPASANFHRWLTPIEVGERFGAPADRIEAVSAWLRSNGLSVDAVSNSRTRIRFSGTAAAVGAAFGSPMRLYSVGGEQRMAISGAPAIPEELADVVQAVAGLESVNEKPHEHPGGVVRAAAGDEGLKSTICSGATCRHFVWPADFATIYDLYPAYQSSGQGAGQTVAVIGRSTVFMQDIENFQARANLAVHDPIVIVPPGGVDPGPAQTTPPDDTSTLADQSEATLDVTRVAGTAPDATIKLVISKNLQTASGIGIAAQYVVDTVPLPAQVMTISFGTCEQNAGQAGVAFWDNLFSQAAAEGISSFASSGDSGVAGCDEHHAAPPPNQVASPSYICSSSYVTCVGGTEFSDSTNYWSTTNFGGHRSALGYIPEGAWNEPLDSSGNLQVAATGGGISAYIATPSWQTGPGVPGKQGRYTPDVSFDAASNAGYVKCQAASGGSCQLDTSGAFTFIYTSGTSGSAPSMAGIAALLNEKMGGAQGNLNPGLYKLAANPDNGVFHDVTLTTSSVSPCDLGTPSKCNNSTPGQAALQGGLAGYAVGPGYDLATGLGSLDVANFVAQWSSVATPATNYQGLWWASPAGSESGWGINFAHQGDTIFATWFTYDLSGNGNWLVMTAPRTAARTYAGTLYATTGPAFSSIPFNPASVAAIAVGTGSLTFSDANNGTFSYAIGATSQSKAITREVFGTMPTCAMATSSLASATNYTDLWWASPAGSESGWGINLTHEGTTIFGSWFTYDTTGKPMWLVVTAPLAAPSTYSGTLYRTTGPAFNAVPFNPSSVVATPVGSATFSFIDGNNATFTYAVNGVSQAKAITREIFGSTGTVCR